MPRAPAISIPSTVILFPRKLIVALRGSCVTPSNCGQICLEIGSFEPRWSLYQQDTQCVRICLRVIDLVNRWVKTDGGGRPAETAKPPEVVAQSMQLVAGRIAQEWTGAKRVHMKGARSGTLCSARPTRGTNTGLRKQDGLNSRCADI